MAVAGGWSAVMSLTAEPPRVAVAINRDGFRDCDEFWRWHVQHPPGQGYAYGAQGWLLMVKVVLTPAIFGGR